MLTLATRLMGMIRFSHTLFALPFALLSATLAWRMEKFRYIDLLGILLCMVFARSAAMAFNRIADRHIDALNPRTAKRHLPTGTLSLGVAIAFLAICCLGFIASTFLFLVREPANPWPAILAVPVLCFLCAYSYTKRFTILAHFWLGASLMLAPIAAWIAVCGREWAVPGLEISLLIGAAVLFWVAGFDILYACQDADFDRKAKLSSIPARFGIRASLRIALGCHAVMLALLFALYFTCPYLGTVFLIGLLAIAALLAYEHWLVRPDDLTRVNQAFFQVNGIISVGLFVLVLIEVNLH